MCVYANKDKGCIMTKTVHCTPFFRLKFIFRPGIRPLKCQALRWFWGKNWQELDKNFKNESCSLVVLHRNGRGISKIWGITRALILASTQRFRSVVTLQTNLYLQPLDAQKSKYICFRPKGRRRWKGGYIGIKGRRELFLACKFYNLISSRWSSP